MTNVSDGCSFPEAYLTIERAQCQKLGEINYGPPVTNVYSPVEYAAETHELYVRKFCTGTKEVLFLGMNPGPFGMAQNGVPFGDTEYVRNWMKIEGDVGRPLAEHPKRKILGLHCTRSEVSGQRFWGLFSSLCPSPETFFEHCFVHNYCPLAFLTSSGSNITPNKLPLEARRALHVCCDGALLSVLVLLRPKLVIGVGRYARERTLNALKGALGHDLVDWDMKVASVTHPSPASPRANKGWKDLALRELDQLGVLAYFDSP
ncbi:single-strand selective monofunctional uracil DNA glycosylase-like [Ornithodoros turicata]